MAKAPSSGPQYQRALAAYLQAVEADEGFARLTRKAQAQQLDVPLRTMERVWKDIKAKPVADDPERLPGVLSVYWMRGAKAYQLRGDISQHRALPERLPDERRAGPA